jgi:Domain of unknown function (DUF4118)
MTRYRDQVALVAAVLAPFAVCAALVPLRTTSFAGTNSALVLVVVIVAIAINGHRLAGALAALSAAVWFDFFLTQPYEHFTVTRSEDIATTVLLLAVGLAVSQLAARARRLRVVVITDADYLAQIQHTAELAQSGAAANTIVEQVRGQLVRLLQLQGCRFEYGTLLGHPPRLERDGRITSGRTHWDIDRRGLPDEEIELRASAGGRFHGRFMLRPTPAAVPSLQARLVAVTLADQTGAAFDASRTGGNQR